MELADGRYDMIVLLDVLEHIEDDVGSLRVLRRKLAPGGRMVLTVPAAPWLWSAHDVAHHHKRRYTAATLRAAFAAGGLRVRHISHFNTLLYPLVAAARIIGRITGREGSDDAMPPAPLNGLLEHVFAAERHWVTRGCAALRRILAGGGRTRRRVNDPEQHAVLLALPDRLKFGIVGPALARHVDHPQIVERVAREILQRQLEDRLVARAAVGPTHDL